MEYDDPTAFSRKTNLWNLIHEVTRFGELVESRYGPCYEIQGGRLVVPSGALVYRKGINYSLGWMEMFQLLAGVYDLPAIQRIAPAANHSLFTYSMAYGPRAIPRLPRIIEALRSDSNTRQAVLFIGIPEDGPTSDLPCTLTMQFLIRKGLLDAVVSMRSWDLCRGLPYDLMMFSGLLKMVGRILLLPTGRITVLSGSTHIYMDQMDKIPKLSGTSWDFDETVPDTLAESSQWFLEQIPNIEQKKVPPGIVLMDDM